ncbi:hypothetical protein VTN77DRAFT_6525 [Rasamsonia byssochlamydoides]|uniref:uncharacterized protein n=1 Tax=Rasamsonia byssochlamydoides TaxID=89139 RepID=UPI00374467BB
MALAALIIPLATASSSSSSSSIPTTTQSSTIHLHKRLPFPTLNTYRKAHGILMSISFLVLFPAFALTLYLVPYSKTASRIHAPLQVATLVLVVAGFGLGIQVERSFELARQHHPVIGTVVVVYLLVCQPVMGYLQHRYFVRRRKQQGQGEEVTEGTTSVFGYLHRWVGRAMLVLGIVNGGLGLQLARKEAGDQGAPRGVEIAYGVVAGVVGVVYLVVVVGSAFVKLRRGRSRSADGREKGQSSATSNASSA